MRKTPTEPAAAAGLLLAALLVLSPASAGASCAEDVARVVQAHYDSVRDLRARFEQTTRSALFGDRGAAPSRGEVVFAKPGRMRWTYAEPEPSLVVSDGKTLWLYSPTLKEAQRMVVSEGALTGAALQFLLGEGKLLESFEVSSETCPFEPEVDAAGTGSPRKTVELDLVPKQPASYERLGLTARLDTGEVLGTRLVDLFGNETVIRFDGIEVNRDPAPDTFRFEPADDVTVIELQPTP